MRKKRGGIYALAHKEQPRVYIGQTRDLERRRRSYENPTESDTRQIAQAIRRHGRQAFTWHVLEYCDDDALYERERYWIAAFNVCSYPRWHYNRTKGGEGAPRSEAAMDSEKKAETQKSFLFPLEEVSEETQATIGETASDDLKAYGEAQDALRQEVPDKWIEYVKAKRKLIEACPDGWKAYVKAHREYEAAGKTRREHEAARRWSMWMEAWKALQVAAPDELKVYEAAWKALQAAAPDKWKAYVRAKATF